MRKSKFTDGQIAFALKQAELGISVEEVCRKMGLSDATFCVWRKKYDGVDPPARQGAKLPICPKGMKWSIAVIAEV